MKNCTKKKTIKAKLDSADNSTCCDEDFTWVCKDKTDEMNVAPNAYSASNAAAKHSPGMAMDADKNGNVTNSKRTRQLRPSSSLDRRRIHSRNRQERDSKSRSAHSLQESSATSTTDYASPEYPSGTFNFEFQFKNVSYCWLCCSLSAWAMA